MKDLLKICWDARDSNGISFILWTLQYWFFPLLILLGIVRIGENIPARWGKIGNILQFFILIIVLCLTGLWIYIIFPSVMAFLSACLVMAIIASIWEPKTIVIVIPIVYYFNFC